MLPKLNSHILAWPTDWADLFGTARPLILEIGFGRGEFLHHLAHLYPDHNIVGLEISNRCLDKVERMITREALPHVRVIHSRAETALHHLFEPAMLSRVYINFPDPWFKSKHGHRRLMQRNTLDAIVSRLQPDGELYLATDIIEYAEMSHALLADTPGLDNQFATPWVYEMPGRVVTKYEDKARQEGRPCHYFFYRRNQTSAPVVPVIKELEMPHVVIANPLTLEDIRLAFKPREYNADGMHITMNQVYVADRTLLFDVYIAEPTIDQRVAIVLISRESNPHEFTLQLSMLGHPRPTSGVHRAVNLLKEWLLGLHPESKVLISKLQSYQPETDLS